MVASITHGISDEDLVTETEEEDFLFDEESDESKEDSEDTEESSSEES